MKTTIKGAFADCIRRIEHHSNETTPKSMLTTQVEAGNDESKERMAELFASCISFEIMDDCVSFRVRRPQEDIDKFHEERKYSLTCNIKQLKKWCDSKEEYKDEILAYLEAAEKNWIAKKMAKYTAEKGNA